MGFTVNNSFGKFSAETNTPLPIFSAESLLSLPTQQFGAATIDGNSVSNYDATHWSRFTVDTSGFTNNSDGLIKTRSDKGFQFVNKADSGKTLKIKLHNAAKNLSKIFTLAPGDKIFRDGGYSTVVTVPAAGTESVDGVVTTIPWMMGWRDTDADVEKKYSNTGSRHDYFIEVLPAVDLVDASGGTGGGNGNGTGASSTCATENRVANTDDTCGECLSGFTEDSTGVCVADATEEEGPNYLLYGGGLALLVVGGIMASKMMKK